MIRYSQSIQTTDVINSVGGVTDFGAMDEEIHAVKSFIVGQVNSFPDADDK